jgi:hypothetical protein
VRCIAHPSPSLSFFWQFLIVDLCHTFVEAIEGRLHRCSMTLNAFPIRSVTMKDMGVLRVGEGGHDALCEIGLLGSGSTRRT